MSIKFDVNQSSWKAYRSPLDQLFKVSGVDLDSVLTRINEELTPPLRMKESSTPDRVLNVGAINKINSDTLINRTIQPINGTIPTFTSGTITLPAASGSNIVVSPGSNVMLTISNSMFIKALVGVDETGAQIVTLGTQAASIAAAALPTEPANTRSIGYFIIEANGSGVIQNVINSRIFQFMGGGAGSGSGGGMKSREVVSSQTGTTITFTSAYTLGARGNCFFQNGVLMKKVVSAPGANEYIEASTTTITLGIAAIAADQFDCIQFGDAGALEVSLDGSSVATDVNTINFVSPGWTITDQGGGVIDVEVAASGGGGAGSDPLQDITNAELSDSQEFESNDQFIDDAEETNKTTLTNMVQSNSAFRLSGVNLTGNMKRDKESSVTRNSVSGIATLNLQMLAPKATALSPSSTATSVSIVLRGDVTAWFPSSKKVVMAKKVNSGDTNSDGKTLHIIVMDPTTNKPAILSITSSTYSSLNDETTVVLANPNAADLDSDVATVDFPDKLRIIPYNYVIKANSAQATSPTYETVGIDNIYGLDVVAMQGEQFLSQITDVAIDGRILMFHAEVSPNRMYKIFRLLEDDSGNETWRFFGQVGSNTPVYLGTKSLAASAIAEEQGGDFERNNRAGIIVADNGKCLFTYKTTASGNTACYAVTADMSNVSPATTFADIVTNGAGAGIVHSSGSENTYFSLAGDTADLSFVMILTRLQTSNTLQGYAYTAGGTTYASGSSFSAISNVYVNNAGVRPTVDAIVTGTGTSHRTHFFYTSSSTNNVKGSYIDQGSTSVSNYNSGSDISANGTASNAAKASSVIATATKGVVHYISLDASSNWTTYMRSFDLTGGSPAISSQSLVIPSSSANSKGYNYNYGYSSSSQPNAHRALRQLAVSNPSDGNHNMVCYDVSHPDGLVRPMVFEYRDITSIQGVHISNYTTNATGFFRNATGNTERGMTFLANTNRVRSIGMLGYQTGKIAAGQTVSMKIYATSAGLPTTLIATSSNSIDPSTITKGTSGQWMYWNFNGVSLTNATTYAFALSGTFTIDGSNYLEFLRNTSSVYADGNDVQYNGSAWSASAASDFAFEISGDWITELGNAEQSGMSFSGTNIPNQETSLCNIDNNQIQLLWRRMTQPTGNTENPRCGIPYRRVGTWSSTANTQSTWTSAANAAYRSDSYDPFTTFNVSYGSSDSDRLNLNTGAAGNTPIEERSGWGHSVSSATVPTATTDASFYSGFCLEFNGSTHKSIVANSVSHDLKAGIPFFLEVEVKPNSVASGQTIVGKYGAGDRGWELTSIGSGNLRFLISDTGGSTLGDASTNSTPIAVSTYRVVRVTYDGSLSSAPRIFTATTPGGSFTECTYSSTTAFASGTTASTTGMGAGARGSSANFFSGRIGYVKLNKGSSTQVYTGFKNQTSVTNIQNIGVWLLGKQMLGEVGVDLNYTKFVQLKQNAALVDSYPLVVEASLSFASTGRYMHLEIDAERTTTIDNSNTENYNFRFNK